MSTRPEAFMISPFDWQQNTFYLGSGTQALQWTYSRSFLNSGNMSTGWGGPGYFYAGRDSSHYHACTHQSIPDDQGNGELRVLGEGNAAHRLSVAIQRNQPGQSHQQFPYHYQCSTDQLRNL